MSENKLKPYIFMVDRAYLAFEFFDTFVFDTEFFKGNRKEPGTQSPDDETLELVNKISDDLYRLYQMLGARLL